VSGRPKHYDRPGKRPGPPRVRASGRGGSITDQRGGDWQAAQEREVSRMALVAELLDIHEGNEP